MVRRYRTHSVAKSPSLLLNKCDDLVMRVESMVLSSGQTVDVIECDDLPPLAGVVLLHGSGTSERLSLRSLANSLADRGIASVIPDWHPATHHDSITGAIDFADEMFKRMSVPSDRKTVVGYSAGGPIALGLTLTQEPRFERCIAIATSSFQTLPAGVANERRAIRVLLVHGDADPVRPASESQRLNERLGQAGVDSQTAVIEGGTHANVVCASFEPTLGLSNPAPTLSPPMRQSVDAIVRFVLA